MGTGFQMSQILWDKMRFYLTVWNIAGMWHFGTISHTACQLVSIRKTVEFRLIWPDLCIHNLTMWLEFFKDVASLFICKKERQKRGNILTCCKQSRNATIAWSNLYKWKKDSKQCSLDTLMVNKENYYREYKGHTKWLRLISSHFAKNIFFAWHFFMHMLIISVLYVQSKSSGTSRFPHVCTI